ncbi:MAG: hypothetical protein LBS25_06630, partial [Candidatus Symbiothrix sp.]|nr:hypothetical protein [Candidatus Symbiothrix sp.]
MRIYQKLLPFVMCLLFSTAFAEELQYGLRFYSYDYDPEMRTSLNLSSDYLSFPHGFSMHFDAKFHFKEKHTYGYVFRIVDKKQRSINLLLGEKNISFSSSIQNVVFTRSLPEINIQPEKWIPIRLDVDTKNEELTIFIGETSQKWQLSELHDFTKANIVFGKNNAFIDVPAMTVKDVWIDDMDANKLYYWKLSEYTANGVYDELKHKFAQVENPNWILDRNTTWKKEITFTTGKNPYLTFDSQQNCIAVADPHFFFRYSLSDNQLKKQEVIRSFPYPFFENSMIYNSLDNNFYAYNLIREENGRELAKYDSIKGSWDETTDHFNKTDYWHHNRYLSHKHNRLYLFGGYGQHKYKKGAFVYDISTQKWFKEDLKGDTIEPRYLSGLGVIDEDNMLLFGGFGSPTGNQDLFPRNYYDAYIINLPTMQSKKLWTLDTPAENYVVSNSLVVDTVHHCFYALCWPSTKYNTSARLYKFSLDRPEYEILADSITFGFKDNRSYVDLFFDSAENKLIAVTFSPVEEETASVSIYSLVFPPLKKSDLQQLENRHTGIIIASVVLGLILLLIAFFLFYRKKGIFFIITGKNKTGQPSSGVSEQQQNPIVGINTVKQLQKQAILLFGGFQVIDKEGNDVTVEFKPLLKSLFLLIFLNTIKNGKGISSVKLKEILWFDKTEESANNNRGVALSQIRRILERVGEVQFSKQGQYWMVEFGNDIYCDY